MCPLHYAPEIPLQVLPSHLMPNLSTAKGDSIHVTGRKTIKYMLRDGLHLTVNYWVCAVQHPLISVRSLTHSELTVLFTRSGGWLSNASGTQYTSLVSDGPLWYLNAIGRTDGSTLDGKTTTTTSPSQDTTSTTTKTPHDIDYYNYYIAPLLTQPLPPATSWSNYWLIKLDCLVRLHKSARRKLYSPTDSPTDLDKLTGQRITYMKNYSTGATTTRVLMTSNPLTLQPSLFQMVLGLDTLCFHSNKTHFHKNHNYHKTYLTSSTSQVNN